MKLSTLRNVVLLGIGSVLLAACDHNDNKRNTPEPEPVTRTYYLGLLNVTESQPFSPVTALIHNDQRLWEVGESASVPLEILAEGGDNSELMILDGVTMAETGLAPLPPGYSEGFEFTIDEDDVAYLTVVTMLVNTNDAFTGITNKSLAELAVHDSITMMLPVYDAGTEANDEVAGTIPGPADGGEGFNAERDDADTVSYHPGVVSSQDGLPESVLMAEHRFDNPVARLIITRVE
ncbi:hypothetical protein FJ444_11435 [Aestuariibacter sp. GS-14]|uniref:spondin domain-containing protein n=1 Tax=Aestuariibacter sp. GS-14 TaxID=2590670 RepID=UPI001129B9D1|nr:spondin domain-containing protein [Aestuariibacter sp. GS-14]TPV57775.1 hypothetical protein FJ444_11435 [Aestuariibacter sp. GS-14]